MEPKCPMAAGLAPLGWRSWRHQDVLAAAEWLAGESVADAGRRYPRGRASVNDLSEFKKGLIDGIIFSVFVVLVGVLYRLF